MSPITEEWIYGITCKDVLTFLFLFIYLFVSLFNKISTFLYPQFLMNFKIFLFALKSRAMFLPVNIRKF